MNVMKGVEDIPKSLPGGGRWLEQKAEGYLATIASGEVTYRDGEFSGARPGCLVRGAR